MTMGRTAVRCPAVVALYFVCIGLYPILGLKVNLTAEGEVGGIATLNCTVSPEKAEIQWLFKDKPLNNTRIKTENKTVEHSSKDKDGSHLKSIISTLTITNVTSEDSGNYTCFAKLGDINDTKVKNLDLHFEPKLIKANGPIHTNKTENITMECVFDVYNLTSSKWYKNDSKETHEYESKVEKLNERLIKMSLTTAIRNVNDDNGTYICEIEDGVTKKEGAVEVLVYDQPKIMNLKGLGISTTEVYLKWELLNYNSRIEDIHIYIYCGKVNESPTLKNGTVVKNSSTVLSGLKENTTYMVRLQLKTDGFEDYNTKYTNVTTLATEPVFVPNITINGFSATSVTIGWAPPATEIEQFIHYYLLEAKKKDENVSRIAYHSRDGRNLPYMFDNLEPHSTYIFQVRACSDYGTERCGNWSDKMEAATLDGVPSKPTNVTMKCTQNMIHLSWLEPAQPKAEIKGYTMELTGKATFRDRHGQYKEVTWGPLSKFTKNDSRNGRFDDLQPNTNYTVRLSAMTRTRRRGEEEVAHCLTPPAPPDHPPRPRWRKIFENDKYMFKVYLPMVSERNGPICCYRVYMVHMLPQTDWKNLSEPMSMPVLDYERAHADPPVLAAYITDIFSNDKFPSDSELVMGDSNSLFDKEGDKMLRTPDCKRCLSGRDTDVIPTTILTTTTTTNAPVDDSADGLDDEISTEDPNDAVPETLGKDRRRRSYYGDNYADNQIMKDKLKAESQVTRLVQDGRLDPNAKYTLFVELIPGSPQELPQYSNYVNVLQAAPTAAASQPASTLEITLQVTCALAALILLLMIVFCIRQSRRSRKIPPHAIVELNSMQKVMRMFGRGGRQQVVATVPPDMPPIPKEDLPDAYAERQADSDYGFQKEFEHINMVQYNAELVPKSTKLLQMLPECFPDRTTHASDARENQPKNRYPDIKAYDQTRVKLSQIDSITGSDYINANFVRGYQERKQFICAQGPTDTTVNDFWRMIWEHGLELIVMLTNLEEYSKVKCSKYWPDEIRGSRAFGAITVHHVSEKRYSDYIVRELRITKQATNSDGQPIVENNGVAKRNGDIKECAEGVASVPTSPREVKEAESRIVRQYHFLMWKDFAAPEHAYSILKFIKRVNEAWSSTLSRPCVVHCSAGVGRTGTLVALDCLLQQHKEQGQVAVFNTVAELRTQRNFLVQSLKQYIFVYRALVEYTVYGDTEIPAHRLKAAVDRLRNTPPTAAHCLMEIHFQKILNNPIPEPVKSCAAGAAEELRNKNRSQDILPYDRNRVILAPIPSRDYSTYINASFIEAYDNSEGFIITQDPLPNTIMDFWRMVSEHNVSTIVMLSELGEGKCPRYWEDSLAQYEHIGVQYEESESCPYYTRRQFRVMNNKSGVSSSVVHLQYQGWPTAAGHVPEVTRGLAELADAAGAPHLDRPTMLVHCQYGTERSSLFVALCILISQLRAERRVDVCSVTRKVRSQRTHTIDTFLHYEFLHRAILNYAELHNLLEDS